MSYENRDVYLEKKRTFRSPRTLTKDELLALENNEKGIRIGSSTSCMEVPPRYLQEFLAYVTAQNYIVTCESGHRPPLGEVA